MVMPDFSPETFMNKAMPHMRCMSAGLIGFD